MDVSLLKGRFNLSSRSNIKETTQDVEAIYNNSHMLVRNRGKIR
jgi:hypothetical protein